jgi:general secretion pathway protein L
MIISLESSLGIQFGHHYACLVFLKKFVHKVVLDCCELISVPEDTPKKEHDGFLTREISRIVREKNLSTDNVWVGLPRNQTLLRLITLPATAEENLGEVVRYEVGKYVSFPMDDIVYDFSVVGRDPEKKDLNVLLVITQKATFERAFSILEKAGLQPLGMEVSTTALINLAFAKKNGNGSKNTVALVQVGRDDFETAWLHSGELRYSHVTKFDGEGETSRAAQIRREIRSGFRAAFAFQQWKGPGGIGSSLIYITGEKDLDEILAKIKGESDLSVSAFPAELVDIQGGLTTSSIPQAALPVVGLALRGMMKVPYTINLLPQNLRRKSKKGGIYLSIILFIVVAALSVTWGASSIVKKRLVLHKIEREIEALKHEVAAVQAIQEEAQSVEEMMACIVNATDRKMGNLMILKELSTLIPPSVWLTNLRYHKGEVQLSGYAESASNLIAILDGSPLFHASEFAAPITRDRQGRESFKIKTKIEG